MGRAGRHETDGASALAVWLRLLSCSNTASRNLRLNLKNAFDVTLPRFDLMAQVAREPLGPSLGELSRRLLVTKGNITDLVVRLEKDGLVERRRDDSDGRVQHVYLTAAGQDLLDAMLAAHNRWLKEMLADLDAGKVSSLYQLLGDLRQALHSGVETEDEVAAAAQ